MGACFAYYTDGPRNSRDMEIRNAQILITVTGCSYSHS